MTRRRSSSHFVVSINPLLYWRLSSPFPLLLDNEEKDSSGSKTNCVGFLLQKRWQCQKPSTTTLFLPHSNPSV